MVPQKNNEMVLLVLLNFRSYFPTSLIGGSDPPNDGTVRVLTHVDALPRRNILQNQHHEDIFMNTQDRTADLSIVRNHEKLPQAHFRYIPGYLKSNQSHAHVVFYAARQPVFSPTFWSTCQLTSCMDTVCVYSWS